MQSEAHQRPIKGPYISSASASVQGRAEEPSHQATRRKQLYDVAVRTLVFDLLCSVNF